MLRKKDFFQDFKLEDIYNEKKKKIEKISVYAGEYYTINVENSKFIKRKIEYLFIILTLVILYLFIGIYPGQASYHILNLLPYAIEFLPTSFVVLACGNIFLTGERLNSKQLYYSYHRLQWSSIFLIVVSGVSTICGLLCLIFYTKSVFDYIFLGGEAGIFLISVIALRCYKTTIISVDKTS